MADSLSTVGSIADFIQISFNNVPTGLSGVNLIALVDTARQHVENYTKTSIGSTNIADEFQPPIINFSKADTIDFVQAQAGGEKIKLGELSVDESGENMSSTAWRMLAESQLQSLGRGIEFRRSIA